MRVEHAEGAIDLPRLLALVPSSLLPLEVERARLRYRVHHLLVAAAPRLDDDGSAVDRRRARRCACCGADGAIALDGGTLSVTARPEAGADAPARDRAAGVAARRRGRGTTAGGPRRRAVAGEPSTLRIARDGALAGDAARATASCGSAAPTPLWARDGELGAHAEELRVDAAAPLVTRGPV